VGAGKNSWGYKEVKREFLDTLMRTTCSGEDLEFIDLYPILDSISSDEQEHLVLLESLKSIGFEATHWGRGNWMEGPRIVSYTMSNGSCECQVDKLYYSTKAKNQYRVTERIKCKNVE